MTATVLMPNIARIPKLKGPPRSRLSALTGG